MLILFYNFIFHYLEITQAKWDPLYVMYDFVRFIFQSTDFTKEDIYVVYGGGQAQFGAGGLEHRKL